MTLFIDQSNKQFMITMDLTSVPLESRWRTLTPYFIQSLNEQLIIILSFYKKYGWIYVKFNEWIKIGKCAQN